MKHKKKNRIILFIIVGSLLLLILGIGFLYVYNNIYHKKITVSKVEYPIRGIDVSAHNGDIDFNSVRDDNTSFVYIKATEGVSFKDSKFEENYEKAITAGLYVGAYHFFRFEMNGTLQAQNFLESIKGKSFGLPIVIDVEQHGNPEVDAVSVKKRLKDMIDYLNVPDSKIIIYTNVNGYNLYIKKDFSEYMLWICRFSPPDSTIKWQLWQYSHWDNVDGIEGDVDSNVFRGDKDNFDNLVGEYTF